MLLAPAGGEERWGGVEVAGRAQATVSKPFLQISGIVSDYVLSDLRAGTHPALYRSAFTLGSISSTSREVHKHNAPKLLLSSVSFVLLFSSARVGSLFTPTSGMLSPRKWLADNTVPSPPTDITRSTCHPSIMSRGARGAKASTCLI